MRRGKTFGGSGDGESCDDGAAAVPIPVVVVVCEMSKENSEQECLVKVSQFESTSGLKRLTDLRLVENPRWLMC